MSAPHKPLSALLSQILVAYSVEVDCEFERRMLQTRSRSAPRRATRCSWRFILACRQVHGRLRALPESYLRSQILFFLILPSPWLTACLLGPSQSRSNSRLRALNAVSSASKHGKASVR